ncbi:DegV family protein [Kurthia sibirica]|uniref:Fatty acid-binding protein DegV n=1 Tax=Kurthia sibirica TaxID=202750 RepID=A0A2U3AMM4_9BACL|nr:DegV family protein [Kurthia sibirica]PWI25784.1 fatty acid-binding protein DegV [Kurthia sibirica]GEK35102.1 hypothetical protein KSI01_26350 [Kurthia sibirica]
MTTAIVTDSTAYLTPEERQKYNIHMVPLSVVIEQESFEEEVSISMSVFYDKVRDQKQLPKTTQPAIGKFITMYEELAKEHDEVVTIHLSSGISGTYNGALQAGDLVEGITVYGFDSEIACAIQGYFVIRAAKLAQQGATAKTIVTELEKMRDTMSAYFIVNDLAHLQRGGRLSAGAALIGGLLQIKPVLHFDNKVIIPFEKIRTRKKAMKRVEDLLAQAVEKYNGAIEASIIHANCEDEGRAWMTELATKFPTVEFKLSYFGPVIGTHLGEGSIGMGWFKREN